MLFENKKRSVLSLQDEDFLVTAHGGGDWANCDRNTVPALLQAVEAGFGGVEFDVKKTTDDKLPLFHHSNLSLGTNGRGHIEELAYVEILKLKTTHGATIPLLQDAIRSVKKRSDELGRKVILHLDIKSLNSAQAVVETLKESFECGCSENDFIVSSLIHPVLAEIKACLPEIRIVPCVVHIPHPFDAKAFDILRPWGVDVYYGVLEGFPKLVDIFHHAEIRVFAWPIPHYEDAKHMKELGVDGITSDCI